MDAAYLVVGAGSAGCVIASRLSETGAKVVLLEAGPRDWHPWIHVPAGVLKLLYNPLVNWNYASAPEPGTAGRSIHWPRGRVLGGSSSINGMLYVRGNPADFDGWAQMGCRGWSYDDVLPYFRQSEHYAPGDPAYRGKGGVLKVEDYRTILPLTDRFVEAAQQAGHPFRRDLNGAEQEGVGYSQMTRNGRFRGSTARTFLAAAKGRPNLRVETGALATRLLFEGRRCVGVAFRQDGQERSLRASREVILCGGAVNSPQLLQISGIGPAAHLRRIGVEVVHDAAGVGANLQDHYVARVAHRVRDAISIDQLAHGVRLSGEVARFALRGQGALTFGVTSAQVFCRSREGLASPDLQLLFTPASYDPLKFGGGRDDGGGLPGAAGQPRHHHGAIGRPGGEAADPAQLPRRARRPAGDGGRHRLHPRHLRRPRPGAAQRAGAGARAGGDLLGGAAGVYARLRHHDFPPGGHLPDGRGPGQRGGLPATGARRRRAAGGRRLGDADADHRQHQRADHHDRREGCRHDPRGRALERDDR